MGRGKFRKYKINGGDKNVNSKRKKTTRKENNDF